MIRKLTLAAGFGAGYLLGAKAGTQRYDQIMGRCRQLAGVPAVQDAKNSLTDTAGQIGDRAKAAVNETVAAVGEKVSGGSDVVDLGATNSASPTSPKKSSAPMRGAPTSAPASEI